MPILKHSHGDSKLQCQECAAQICPKCMVQCAVGFRCRNCTKKFTTHLVKLTPRIVISSLLVATAIGAGFGYISGSLANFGAFGLAGSCALGYFSGKGLHRVARFKMGWRIISIAAIGLLIGFVNSPLLSEASFYLHPPVPEPGEQAYTQYEFGEWLLNIALFCLGFFGQFFRSI